jgi:formamidopyrimidine-DNA glycosylase
MPELPEVETTKTSLLPLLQQRVQIVEVRESRLRWPIPEDISRLNGQRLIGLQRRSKYILAEFEQDQMLWHLGMSGSFRLATAQDELRKHDHLMIGFEDGTQLRYHDPRRFGCILWLNEESQNKLLNPLGPEPLGDEFNADYLYQKLKNKQVGIKIAMMDNHVVVGVGNIYATESLFNLGIHPAQPASSLSKKQIVQLVDEIKRILKSAIDLGDQPCGISPMLSVKMAIFNKLYWLMVVQVKCVFSVKRHWKILNSDNVPVYFVPNANL